MKKLIASVFFTAVLAFTSCNSAAQQNSNTNVASIQVLQFHLEHRCISCLKIEKLTKATLVNHFPLLSLTLVNVEDKKNQQMAEQFEATGSALFLYNPKTGKKKELTQFAFLKVGNEEQFEAELKKHIEQFIKG
jgi:hypothetical protein